MKSRFVFLAVAIALVVGAGAGFAAHALTGSKSAAAGLGVDPVVARTTPVASTMIPRHASPFATMRATAYA